MTLPEDGTNVCRNALEY